MPEETLPANNVPGDVPAADPNPPAGARPGPIGAILAFFVRLFQRKHPGGFDFEVGPWQSPDVNITGFPGNNPPRPLTNNSCSKGILVYCYAFNWADKCSFAGQLAALQDAIDQVSDYIKNNYRCTNPNCLQETGELVWFGIKCYRNRPTGDGAAVLVRFRCVPEL